MVLLPNGWLSFIGGGIEPGLCTEAGAPPAVPPSEVPPLGPPGGGMGPGGSGGGGIGAGPGAETPPPIGGGGGCACTGEEAELTIVSCNDNNSLDCANTKSLDLIACGGVEPYTWGKTGDILLSTEAGKYVTVTPPENNPEVEGRAYGRAGINHADPCEATASCTEYGCDDQVRVPTGMNCCPVSGQSIGGTFPPCDHELTCDGAVFHTATTAVLGNPVDTRSPEMIAAGCFPCGLQIGSTVTLIDAEGTEVTIVLTA